VRRALLTLLLTAVAAGCGDDEEPSGRAETSPTPPAQETTLTTPPPPGETDSRTVTSTKTTETADSCRLRQLELEPLNASVTCAEARRVAAAYDLSGPKVQEVRGWTCATGTATTRPVVFTCRSTHREFVAREPGG
jgi:hypothetical protein